MIERFAAAKINLALHVTAQRGDGYHEIDTIVGFADTGDRLHFDHAPGGTVELVLSGPFASELVRTDSDGQNNIVVKAARLLAETAGVKDGASITLEKNLPVASGIGGGSADAAATLHCLRALWDLPKDFPLNAIASRLGADVPMCLASRPLRARGIGEQIEPLTGAGGLHAVLVNPGVAVATPQVFAALTDKANVPIGELPGDPFDPAFLGGLRNDLEAPARGLFPDIGEVLDLIATQKGCLLARMSGSGATCFGLFADREAANAAHRAIVDTAGQWWSAPVEIAGATPPREN